MRHPKLPEMLQKLRLYFTQLYSDRLFSLILFGSQARNDAQLDSDIDVLVVLRGDVDSWTEIKRTGEFVSDLCLEYGVVICNIFVSTEQFETQQSAFLRTVNQEGIGL